MAFTCDFCGAEYDDPGEGYVAHLQASPACREKFEHEADTLKEEWSKR